MDMAPKPFVLHLSGHSCAGKSTLAKALEDKLPGMYIVSYDKMKWQLADYVSSKDGPLIDKLVLGFFEVVCREHIPILLDSYFKDEDAYLHCRQIATEHGYNFLSVEITAPLEVRLERFRKRVAEAKRMGTKISIKDEETFMERSAKKFYFPDGKMSFDTSLMKIEDIAQQIMQYL